MTQQARSLDVPQELYAESLTFVCSLDQPGYIGHQEALVFADRNDSQARLKRCERIVGDLGMGGRDAGNQGRFSDVRETDQSHIGQQFQLQPNDSFFRGSSGLKMSRGLVG